MARELLVSHTTALAVYAVGRVDSGDSIGFWGDVDNNSLEAFQAGSWGRYDVPMTELGGTGLYEADMDSVFDAQRSVEIIYFVRAGAVPAVGDTKIAGSLFERQGTNWVATSGVRV